MGVRFESAMGAVSLCRFRASLRAIESFPNGNEREEDFMLLSFGTPGAPLGGLGKFMVVGCREPSLALPNCLLLELCVIEGLTFRYPWIIQLNLAVKNNNKSIMTTIQFYNNITLCCVHVYFPPFSPMDIQPPKSSLTTTPTRYRQQLTLKIEFLQNQLLPVS
jgi:hypothetical protein